jgi:hypothetical protein
MTHTNKEILSMYLLDATKEAVDQIGTWVIPNIKEWAVAIDPVLRAYGVPVIGPHQVMNIVIDDAILRIFIQTSGRTYWSHWEEINIPMDIIRSDDPIRSATWQALQRDVTHAQERVTDAKAELARRQLQLDRLITAMDSFNREFGEGC